MAEIWNIIFVVSKTIVYKNYIVIPSIKMVLTTKLILTIITI